jgi:glycosyltransferase involved in cell wall biosynthesis
MQASICLSTYSKPKYLKRVLESIARQKPPFDYEVIVVDDGSPDFETESVCIKAEVQNLRYYRINREPTYRNPAAARNLAYDQSNGEILILQSDDVVHIGEAITGLVDLVRDENFVIATVYNVDFDTNQPVYYLGKWFQLTGPRMNRKHSPNPTRPLFFLGSIYREHVIAIGGCDEDFVDPGREDVWFADCLINGLGLAPHFTAKVVGHHLDHERPENLKSRMRSSSSLYNEKAKEAWRTGAWRARKGLLSKAAAP